MKDELKNILLMGLGAISLTGEKAIELKKELLEKGEKLYKEGSVRNEELKRELKDKIKENVTVEVAPTTKEDVVELINNMTDEEKKEIQKLLNASKAEEKKEVKIEEEKEDKEDK